MCIRDSYDAGLFYCPYVPLQMVRAVGQDTFQPKIGFKTRYGIVANPFAEGTGVGGGNLNVNANRYYRRVKVANLMWSQFTYFSGGRKTPFFCLNI